MFVEPASVDQIRRGTDGRMQIVDADVGGIAAELKRMDEGLKIRFVENGDPPCFVVFHEYHPGCDRNGDVGEGGSYMVTSLQGWQNSFGVWEIDPRLISKMRTISSPDYDYAEEIAKAELARKKANKDAARERVEAVAEQTLRAAHAARKELGLDSGRVFVPRNVQ